MYISKKLYLSLVHNPINFANTILIPNRAEIKTLLVHNLYHIPSHCTEVTIEFESKTLKVHHVHASFNIYQINKRQFNILQHTTHLHESVDLKTISCNCKHSK